MRTDTTRFTSLLRELAGPLHPRRGELLRTVADVVAAGDEIRLARLVAVAARAPRKPVPRGGYADPYASDRASATRNRKAADLLRGAVQRGDEAALAHALAASFHESGAAMFHLLRAACGLPACFDEGFDLGSSYGPTLGPLLRSRDDFARYFVEYMKADRLDGEGVGAALWYGLRSLGLLDEVPLDDVVERVDSWLSRAKPSADPVKAAERALAAVGIGTKAARTLLAAVRSARPARAATAAAAPPTHPRVVTARAAAPQRVLPNVVTANEDEDEDEDEHARLRRTPIPAHGFTTGGRWMRGLARLSPEGAHDRLAEQWASAPAWLWPLRDVILGGRVEGIVEGEGGAFVEVSLARRGMRYVAPPTAAATARRTLATFGFGAAHPLVAFVAFFDGLREMPPGISGGFLPLTEFAPVARVRRRASSFLSLVDADELRPWRDGLVVFERRNGDSLLVHRDGPVAWAGHDPEGVETVARSFDEFVIERSSRRSFDE